MTGFDNDLIEMKLSEMQRICQDIGIDIEKYHTLICEMFWDGHCAQEIKQAVDVEEGDYSI